jgi:cytolysin (calcineurin-like family phosphatase)
MRENMFGRSSGIAGKFGENCMLKYVAVAVAALALGACATVTKGTDDTVTFESTPSGATVSFNEVSGRINQQGCTTPCTLELNRKYTYSVEFEKEGYETWVQLLEPKLSGDGTAGMAGNILLGGVIGAAVDASTGAMNDLRPNPMVATLVAADQPLEDETTQEVVDTGVADAAAAGS